MAAKDRMVLIDDFSGGVNNVDHIANLQTNEVKQAINFDISSTGSLVSRPPFTYHDVVPPTGTWFVQYEPLGWFLEPGNRTGAWFIVNSLTGADEPCTAAIWVGLSGVEWQVKKVKDGFTNGIVQYGDTLYMVDNQGGWSWNGSGTAIQHSTMPAGDRILLHKDRLWVTGVRGTSNESVLRFSDIASISGGTTVVTFPQLNFINVSTGDGQRITELREDRNAIIIFRTTSTWVFAYNESPGDGTLGPLNSDIGVTDWRAVTEVDGYFYVLAGLKIFALMQRTYYPMTNERKYVIRTEGKISGSWVSGTLMNYGPRLLAYVEGTLSVMDMGSRNFTTWEPGFTDEDRETASSIIGYGLPHPLGVTLWGANTIVGVSGESAHSYIMMSVDQPSLSRREEMSCLVETKGFDWTEPALWKRLFTWAVDVTATRSVTGYAQPSDISQSVPTWDDMDTATFDELDLNTWDFPLYRPHVFETTHHIPSPYPVSAVAKMRQALWFRQLSFKIELSTDGSQETGPVRVQSVIAQVDARNRQPAGVS